MKVSLIHPERRTSQTVALEGHPADAMSLPKKLGPTHRHELTLKPGEHVEFTAGVGSKKGGTINLIVELALESGDLVREGWLSYSRVFDKPTGMELEVEVQRPSREDLLAAIDSGDGANWSFSLELDPKVALIISIKNHAQGAAHG